MPRAILLLLLLLLPLPGNAHNHLPLEQVGQQGMAVARFMQQWNGPQQPLAELAGSLHFFSLWTPVDSRTTLSSWQAQPPQLKLNLDNRHGPARQLLLSYREPLVDSMQVVLLVDGQPVQHYQAGNHHPFQARAITHRHLLFPLDLPAGRQATVLIEISGRVDRLQQDLQLWQRAAYFERTDSELLARALHYGVLLVFTVFNFLLFMAVRENCYLWFAVLSVSLLLRSMTLGNVFFEYLWPTLPQLQNIMLVSSLMFTSALIGLFALDYLNLRQHSQRLYYLFMLYILVHIPVFLYQAWHGWAIATISSWLLIAWGFSLVLLGSAVWAYRRGERQALWFLAAYSIMLGLSFFSAGSHLFAIELPFVINGELGELIFVVLMSTGLALHLSEAREKAHLSYAQNKAKSDFMAKMSHEIRTPINGVLGMAQLLAETPLSRKQQHYADVISHCSKTLLNIINDILEYSRMEAGKLELEKAPFDLDALLLKNNELFWPQIQARQLEYHFHADVAMPCHVIGDAARLQQIFNNLFSNAIKFTDHGSIRFSTRVLQRDANEALLEFCLSDTGIGMSHDELARIFEPFAQASSSTNRLYGGSGLGLSITHQLAGLMNGELQAQSQPGQGTRFYLRLPLPIDSQPEQQLLLQTARLHGRRVVLLAQHNDIAHRLVNHWQMHSTQFDQPDKLLDHLQAGNPPDLLCLHAELLQDLSAAHKLQLRDYLAQALIYDDHFRNPSLPLAGFEQSVRLQAPFSCQQFFQHVCGVLKLPGTERPSSANHNTIFRPREHLHVLVAEDDATNRLVIRAILKKLHIQHDIVTNGRQALERYQQAPDAFDLILMDCEMPEMDGYQAAAAIRAFEHAQQRRAVPVIALTAHVLQEYEQRCYHSGMNRVLAKPVDIAELTAALDSLSAAD